MKNSRQNGTILSYANTFVNMITGVFLSSFLIRMLGNTEYGIYQTISSFANYLVLLEFGTGTVMTRNLSVCRAKSVGKEEINKNVSTIWVITIILSIVIFFVSVIFYVNIHNIYSESMTDAQISYAEKMFLVLTVYLIASFYIQTLNGIVLAFEKYTFSSRVSLIRIVVRMMLLVALINIIKYSIVIAYVDMLLSIIIALYTLSFCRKGLGVEFNFRKFDKSIFYSSVGLSVAIFLQVIINQSNNNVDKFIIGIKMSPEDVSLYSVGMYIYSIFSSLTTIPISLYAPEVTRNIATGVRGKDLTKTLIPSCRLITLIGGSVLFGFIAIGRQFIEILYGFEYLDAWYVAIVIMIPMFINMSNGVLINVLDALNKRIVRSLILLITTVLNIIMTIIFINYYGIVGAAIATAIASLLGQVIVMNIYYKKSIKIDIFYMLKEAYRGILPFQILSMLISFYLSTVISNIYLSFLIGGVVYCLISFGGYYLFGTDINEKRWLKNLLRRHK